MNCLLPLGQGVDRSDGGRPETDFRGRHLRRTHESGHLGSAMTTLLPSTPGGGIAVGGSASGVRYGESIPWDLMVHPPSSSQHRACRPPLQGYRVRLHAVLSELGCTLPEFPTSSTELC